MWAQLEGLAGIPTVERLSGECELACAQRVGAEITEVGGAWGKGRGGVREGGGVAIKGPGPKNVDEKLNKDNTAA